MPAIIGAKSKWRWNWSPWADKTQTNPNCGLTPPTQFNIIIQEFWPYSWGGEEWDSPPGVENGSWTNLKGYFIEYYCVSLHKEAQAPGLSTTLVSASGQSLELRIDLPWALTSLSALQIQASLIATTYVWLKWTYRLSISRGEASHSVLRGKGFAFNCWTAEMDDTLCLPSGFFFSALFCTSSIKGVACFRVIYLNFVLLSGCQRQAGSC